ncbi:hypothetical protein BD309DRAFT_834673, partial [Dichomitus squalens]
THIGDVERKKVHPEALTKEPKEERKRAREAARERVLREFEEYQLGLAATSIVPTSSSKSESSEGVSYMHIFDFDTSAVERLARSAEKDALRQIEREQAEALKRKPPDFWLSSLTPTYTSSGPPTSLWDVKLQTTRHGGNPAHPLIGVSAKSVQSIPTTERGKTHEPQSKTSLPMYVVQTAAAQQHSHASYVFIVSCLCSYQLTGARIVMKPCGHVPCKTCIDTLLIPEKRCIICDVKLEDKDFLELTQAREGTGYVARGLAGASKRGLLYR